MTFSRRRAGSDGVLLGVKNAQMDALPIDGNVGNPFAVPNAVMDTDDARRIANGATVFSIFRSRDRSQIAKPVVSANAINMVDCLRGLAKDKSVDDAVGADGFPAISAASITRLMYRVKRGPSGEASLPSGAKPLIGEI